MAGFIIAPVANRIARELHAELRAKRIARIDIDIVRASCAVAASFDDWTPDERLTMEDAVLRRVVELAA